MEKLFAKIKKETLNSDEKAEILSNLQSFMEKNPVQEIKSPFYDRWVIFLSRRTLIFPVLASILIISLTGGTVFAAKNSLPGEKLYTIKMLDEKVQSFTAVGIKAQAEVHAAQAVSRLQEVEQMVIKKIPLNTETKKEIRNNFGNQTRELKNHVEELKKSGRGDEAMKIESDFESSMVKHKQAIIELKDTENQKTEDNRGEVKGEKTENKKFEKMRDKYSED